MAGLCNYKGQLIPICAGCILRVPQHLLLHEGHAWAHPTYGEALRKLKVKLHTIPILQQVPPAVNQNCLPPTSVCCVHGQAEVGDCLDSRWMLCLLLIIERARGFRSRWAPYISILPTHYGTVLSALDECSRLTCSACDSSHTVLALIPFLHAECCLL